MITIFDGNSVDTEKMLEFGKLILSKGIDYLFLCGTTGLGPALSFSERMKIIDAFEPLADSSIIQVGSLNLQESEELARKAADGGYHAIASLPPYYYFNVPGEWIIRHLLSLSKIYRLYAYNFPVASNNRIDPSMVQEVNRRGGNIIGIKETVQEISDMLDFKYRLGDEFRVFNGPDNLLIPSLRAGMDGAVGSSSNYLTELFVSTIEKHILDEAHQLQKKLSSALKIVKSYGQWAAIYSAVRMLHGFDPGKPRPPIFPLEPDQESELETRLSAALTLH